MIRVTCPIQHDRATSLCLLATRTLMIGSHWSRRLDVAPILRMSLQPNRSVGFFPERVYVLGSSEHEESEFFSQPSLVLAELVHDNILSGSTVRIESPRFKSRLSLLSMARHVGSRLVWRKGSMLGETSNSQGLFPRTQAYLSLGVALQVPDFPESPSSPSPLAQCSIANDSMAQC